jgi:hypothetical protein
MKGPCENCPKFRECTAPCADLENLIPKNIEVDLQSHYREEIPVSQTNKAIKKQASDEEASIDDFRNIDQEATHDEAESDFSPDMWKKMKECIKDAIPNIKIRRRYRKYLNCDKMTAIAKRAGVAKQTIQKQFARITKNIIKMYNKRYDEEDSYTPFKFKKAGGACRIILKN